MHISAADGLALPERSGTAGSGTDYSSLPDAATWPQSYKIGASAEATDVAVAFPAVLYRDLSGSESIESGNIRLL